MVMEHWNRDKNPPKAGEPALTTTSAVGNTSYFGTRNIHLLAF